MTVGMFHEDGIIKPPMSFWTKDARALNHQCWLNRFELAHRESTLQIIAGKPGCPEDLALQEDLRIGNVLEKILLDADWRAFVREADRNRPAPISFRRLNKGVNHDHNNDLPPVA